MPKLGGFAERDDLFGYGVIGLMDAMERYDPAQGAKFETFSLPRIRGEIYDFIRSQDWAPPSLRRKISAVNAAYDRLESELGEPPTEAQVAAAADVPANQVQKLLNRQHIFSVMSFEDSLNADGELKMDVADDSSKQPENRLMAREKIDALAEAIDALPEKEKLVISLYYYDGLLLREIADMLGITESRVSQIHSKALSRMSAKMKSLR